jgi:hypothetical protein
MRWVLKPTNNQLRYWKLDQDELGAELKYNEQVNSFRLTAADKRLFFIERVGFLQSRYLVKTEYSIDAGELSPGKNRHSGLVSTENKKFHYQLEDGVLLMFSKTETFTVTIEADDINTITQGELCALVFSSVRVLSRQYTRVAKPQLV